MHASMGNPHSIQHMMVKNVQSVAAGTSIQPGQGRPMISARLNEIHPNHMMRSQQPKTAQPQLLALSPSQHVNSVAQDAIRAANSQQIGSVLNEKQRQNVPQNVKSHCTQQFQKINNQVNHNTQHMQTVQGNQQVTTQHHTMSVTQNDQERRLAQNKAYPTQSNQQTLGFSSNVQSSIVPAPLQKQFHADSMNQQQNQQSLFQNQLCQSLNQQHMFSQNDYSELSKHIVLKKFFI